MAGRKREGKGRNSDSDDDDCFLCDDDDDESSCRVAAAACFCLLLWKERVPPLLMMTNTRPVRQLSTDAMQCNTQEHVVPLLLRKVFLADIDARLH